MLINIPTGLGPKTKKKMLSVTYEADPVLHRKRPVVRINYSSLDIINTCKRKALYALEKEIISAEESAATLFGSAIHRGLEVWYSSPRDTRTARSNDCGDPSQEINSKHVCARCHALKGFLEVSAPLQTLDLGDKRHPYNGMRILNAYMDQYLEDPYEIYSDDKGPIIEREFEFCLVDEPEVKIIYFGTVDCVLKNVETGAVYVTDHKTTASLGQEFYSRIKPNHQYTGYIMGAQRAFGIPADMFLVNGIQVAKTKNDFARQITQRTEEDFADLTSAVKWAVKDYLAMKELNTWPQNAPNPCSMYGGCQYRPICEVPKSLQESVMQNMFVGRT